ncbi:crotonobetainyl-CoA:carnitine CoA-transferase CaiB-like acyl-CoA transferase [Thermocatellispora tengchongensis]|uniref:Crotonobetainyl-CoA:carnitine CoA-transferase CaiB-like acyl-CoA transferase n=1 Tax=Thermocatellispora tengchongensis TaxID=1073253 RepID=A0A840PDV5_9ACTN|nr:CoA transferase [Thermocatellispora tengchongensis]MBB5135620.1 crotonobetainyl-CoA:carnitine CoA-transferase CaiB-like acyl-CoA transferase [Thermocatellispora tengchongensis]
MSHASGPGGSSAGARFLGGVRVLDITGALAGPYCTTILSDLGAEVIKVEPVEGDSLRRRLVGPEQRPLPFDLIHRNKRSIAVDIKTDRGRDLVRALAMRSDVLVENFRVGALARQGLSYDDLKGDCPDLVYCSISGFGQFGPMRDAKGIDLVAQAYGGLLSVTGSPGEAPAKAGYPIGDLGTGMWGAIGVLAALLRVRAGLGGSHIDVSLADTIAGWSLWEVADFVGTGEAPAPLGTAHRLVAPYEAFTCGDGAMLVIGVTERSWKAFCAVLGIDLSGDARYDGEYARFVNREQLAELLQARFSTAPRDFWIDRLREAGVPCGPVNDIPQMLNDPQYAARDMFPSDVERFGHRRIVNTPLIADGAPRAQRRAPGIGQDTIALLRELGIGVQEIKALLRDQVVGGAAEALSTVDSEAGAG